MSSESYNADIRSGSYLVDLVRSVVAHNEVKSMTTDLNGMATTVPSFSQSSPRNDYVGRELEAGQLEEEHTLPPVPPTTALEDEELIASFSSGGSPGRRKDPSKSSPRSSITAPEPPSKRSSSAIAALFDHRHHSRLSSNTSNPFNVSIVPLESTSRLRRSSNSSDFSIAQSKRNEDGSKLTRGGPWEVVKWNKLKKISGQVFSEATQRSLGNATYLTVGASIAIGTSKGIIMLFDYQQALQDVIGRGTAAAESGAILSLAISADHSTIAAGHEDGSIFTWDLSQPTNPFLHIPPLTAAQMTARQLDGHVENSAVLHIGFLGRRHTALVSADESGMAFSHIASRGLGTLARNVKTTRLLGRYPSHRTSERRTSVLAFAPLPLGNVTQSTDGMGLIAILTPYLLVVISTTPIAQTHLNVRRIKDVISHGPLTGCLAWFPAVRLKDVPAGETQALSKNKLVYCWSNILTLLEVESSQHETDATGKTAELSFRALGSWKSDETILAVQWMSRSIISVLTVTQRLVILTDNPLRVADSSDLNSKQIYHQDVFSRQLLHVADHTEQRDRSIWSVIPDAYYMSVKAYKGRLFLLGTDDVSLGTLSNWADRLMSLMEAGNPISAIELATSYYNGETNEVTIGLPRDSAKRRALVKDEILKLLDGSLHYLFHDDEHRKDEDEMRSILTELARVTFSACTSIGDYSFLFDEAYEWYSDSSVQDIFLSELEAYIVDDKIDSVPTTIIKDILAWYGSHGLGSRLQSMLCALRTESMDIDDVSTVCMRLKLYDALISVWNRAFTDYVTPLVHILSFSKNLGNNEQAESLEPEQRGHLAEKLFAYIAYTLTGCRYPDGSPMPEQESTSAKAAMYGFIFAESAAHARQSQEGSDLPLNESDSKLNYPYLRRFLHMDALRFMSMLDEVFEDSFLNGDNHQPPSGSKQDRSPDRSALISITRQRIVNILLEVVTPPEFDFEKTVFMDIFLARNLAKYPQFILLSGSSRRQILIDLCHNPRKDLDTDCQLSAEYLLSTYQPPDLLEFVTFFTDAGFFRILKNTFRTSKQFAAWLETYFKDPEDKMGVFTCIADCLRPLSGLSKRQRQEVKALIAKRIPDLASIDVVSTANTLSIYTPEMLAMAAERLGEDSVTQYNFLHAILESPGADHLPNSSLVESFCRSRRESYIRLICKHDISHAAEYMLILTVDDLDLASVLPALEESGALDATVILLTRKGFAPDGMRRLLKHLDSLGKQLQEPITPAREQTGENGNWREFQDALDNVERYVKLGVWLCQYDSSRGYISNGHKTHETTAANAKDEAEKDLATSELLWLDLIDCIASISQAHSAVAEAAAAHEAQGRHAADLSSKTDSTLRRVAQEAFTALLGITSRADVTEAPIRALRPSLEQNQTVRFLRVLTAFMTRLATRTSSIASIRSVLYTIFSAYHFESSMVTLVNALLEKNVFAHVAEANKDRRFGWRPRSQLCEICKRRAWGPSAGRASWSAWQLQQEAHESVWRRPNLPPEGEEAHVPSAQSLDKGKAKDSRARIQNFIEEEAGRAEVATNAEEGGLFVFSCTHLFHSACLVDGTKERAEQGSTILRRCPLCVAVDS